MNDQGDTLMRSTKNKEGFFVFEPEFMDFITGDSMMLEREPITEAVNKEELMAYFHDGFWQCMDTKRDKELLEKLCGSGTPPWAVY